MTLFQFDTAAALQEFLNDHSVSQSLVASIYYDGASGKHVLVAAVEPFDIVYSANPVTYVTGAQITNNAPRSGGDPPTGYAIAPALSAGLNFNTTTGVISGTPTATRTQTTYTITVTNAAGTGTVDVVITVVAP